MILSRIEDDNGNWLQLEIEIENRDYKDCTILSSGLVIRWGSALKVESYYEYDNAMKVIFNG
jgi:hypothetical protein